MNRDDLIANYAAQGAFGAGLGTGTRQAVLMVDFAQAYFEQGSPLYAEAPQTLEGASALLAWARSRSCLYCTPAWNTTPWASMAVTSSAKCRR